jgi:hypothetical protein
MIVTAHIKFSLHTTFLDTMLQAEDERLPGESIEDGVIRVHKELEAAVQRIKDAHRIDLGDYPLPQPVSQTTPGPSVAVIDYGKQDTTPEGLISDIQKATNLSELTPYKLLAAQDKAIYAVYCTRLKELA